MATEKTKKPTTRATDHIPCRRHGNCLQTLVQRDVNMIQTRIKSGLLTNAQCSGFPLNGDLRPADNNITEQCRNLPDNSHRSTNQERQHRLQEEPQQEHRLSDSPKP